MGEEDAWGRLQGVGRGRSSGSCGGAQQALRHYLSGAGEGYICCQVQGVGFPS